MAKFESPIMAIRELRRQGAAEIPKRDTITSMYQRFLENGSVEDHTRSERPSTITEYTIHEVGEALNREPQTSLRKIAREMNISKDKTHRIMPEIIGFKPYMMKKCIYVWKWQNVWHLFLKIQRMMAMFSFQMNQVFMFPEW